jgi:hypothetical protein
MTAAIAQNYGNNSYMILQPFDFANRTGKIVFDVDAVSVSGLASFIGIDLTQDPIPAPTFQERFNFETGPIPNSALMLKWSDNCNTNGTAINLGNVMVYNNYVASIIVPSYAVSGAGCAATKQGFVNHFEIDLSQSHIDIYGSDYSPDGQTFPNFRILYSADLSLPFTRGYVHVAARNHATIKYGYGPDWVYHWDNIGFDGPVISSWRAYEIPDNSTTGTYSMYNNAPIMNLGYQLLDGTTGPAAGIYDPTNPVGPLRFQGVNVIGAAGALLSLNASFNSISHVANSTWGVAFQFNGGPWHNSLLTATQVQILNANVGANGNVGLLMDVPVADLVNGTNTLAMVPVNAPMDYKPTIANIDLILALGTAAPPPAPNNFHIAMIFGNRGPWEILSRPIWQTSTSPSAMR